MSIGTTLLLISFADDAAILILALLIILFMPTLRRRVWAGLKTTKRVFVREVVKPVTAEARQLLKRAKELRNYRLAVVNVSN